MPKAKYKLYYEEMVDQNQQLFDEFQKVHNAFQTLREQKLSKNKQFSQKEMEKASQTFHIKGKKILRIIQDAERRLCGKMERGVHGRYSSTLADKFWNQVKKHFPLIDLVGVEIS